MLFRSLLSLSLSSIIAGLFFAGRITIKKRLHEVRNRSAITPILLSTLFNGVIYYLLTFIALQFTSPGNASIVAMTEIFFSFLFFHIFCKEHLPQTQIIGATSMLVGAIIILLPNFTHFQIGDLLILMAAAVAPFGNFYAQRARKQVGSETIMMIRSLISAFVIFILALIIRVPFSLGAINHSLWFILINGLLLLGLSKVFWIEGIHRIAVTTANAIGCISPLVTLIGAWLVFHQVPTVWQLVSLFPLFVGIRFISKKG